MLGNNSGLMSALMDPGVDALAGLAQGFAQAAMPSRMPVPLGAAIGMGAGGALAGARQSQLMRLAQQQVRGAQLQNRMTQMYLGALPGVVGSSGTSGGQQSPPASLQAAGGGSPSGMSGEGAPPASGASAGYLVPPQRLVALGNLALLRGDPKAAAAFYGQGNTEAGGQGYAMGANGSAFAVPGGGKDPRVLATNAAAVKAAELPSVLTAQGFAMTPNGGLAPITGGKADPAYMRRAALTKPITIRQGGMIRMPNGQTLKNPDLVKVQNADGSIYYSFVQPPEPDAGAPSTAPAADPFPAWAARIQQIENPTGNPAATNPNSTAMGNGQFIASTWPAIVRSTRPDLAAGKTDAQLLALRSNPQISLAMTAAYARQNGALLARQALPVNGGSILLSNVLGGGGAARVLRANPNTPLSMLVGPHAAANNPVLGSTAGSALAWANERMAQAGATPATPPPARPDSGSATPVIGANGQPLMAEIPEQVQNARNEANEEFATKDNDSYVSAQNTLAWVHQITNAADQMTKAGPLYMSGPNAGARYDLFRNINDFEQTLGMKPTFDRSAVASWEEMRKSTTTAGFELASHYEGHARQAAATIMNATSAVPGYENTPVGVQLVAAGIREGAQSAIDLHNFKSSIFKQDAGVGMPTAETDFYQKFPATEYAERAISTVHPVKITAPSQFAKYLPGTYATLPNGRLVQVPERAGAPPVPSYLQPGAQH